MANGAIGPFRGKAEDSNVISQENQSKDTVRRYYARVWNGRDVSAIDDLVTDDFVIHRDNQVRHGKVGLKAQVTETIANFLELRVDLEEMVALRETVAVRLNVWHKTNVTGEWVRLKGVDVSIVKDGRIAETSVRYGASEIVPADEAIKLLPA
ncbi:MAG TPA: nuclear transport factor 2 family protein [Methylomirabilota bacterium]|jgi:ketosteroid isomerase-like protein|nr:nuclear transport factor 2 family protein [Methylomirabilota bacterium]